MRKVALALAAVLVALIAVAWLVAGRSGSEATRRGPRASEERPFAPPAVVATRFLLRFSSLPVIEDARRRNEYLAQFADPRHLTELKRQYAAEAQRVAVSFAARPRATWAGLIGHREQHVGANEVRVDVWAVAIGAAGHSPVGVGWQLVRVTLVRTSDGWKVARVEQRPPPDLDTDAAAFVRATAAFREYRFAP